MLPLERRGFIEECYFTFSYSPINIENGEIGGVFTAVSETSGEGDRRAPPRHVAPAGQLGIECQDGGTGGVVGRTHFIGQFKDLPSVWYTSSRPTRALCWKGWLVLIRRNAVRLRKLS